VQLLAHSLLERIELITDERRGMMKSLTAWLTVHQILSSPLRSLTIQNCFLDTSRSSLLPPPNPSIQSLVMSTHLTYLNVHKTLMDCQDPNWKWFQTCPNLLELPPEPNEQRRENPESVFLAAWYCGRNRAHLELWQRVCFLLAWFRANQGHPLMDSGLDWVRSCYWGFETNLVSLFLEAAG
jgi:hypothetical protein